MFQPAGHAEGLEHAERRASSEQGGKVSFAHVLLYADISKELGKGGLRIEPWCEQQGARAIVLTAELWVGTAHLEEDGHNLEGVLGQAAEGAAGRQSTT